MKLQFTREAYAIFESDLQEMGFKKYNGQLHNENYYLAKSIHRTLPDEDGDTRADLQLFFCVYDFSKYNRFEFKDFMHLQAEIHVSRNIDKRIDLVIDDKAFSSIDNLEIFAFKFHKFICENIPE